LGVFLKPKIAFTYQNNEAGTNISNTFSTQTNTICNKGQESTSKNGSITLSKPSEKENNVASVPI
jgi:hypothetical protein